MRMGMVMEMTSNKRHSRQKKLYSKKRVLKWS